jgi:hypothetical protein
VLLAAAIASSPLLVRLALLVDKRVAVGLGDVHGFVSDVFVASIVTALVAPAVAKRRALGLLLVPWVVLHYATYEFTRTMNAVPPWQSIRYLGDRTFLAGSAFVIGSPLLLAALFVVPVVLIAASWRLPRPSTPLVASAAPFAPAVVVLGATSLAWPADRSVFAWRQTNFVEGNAADMLRRRAGDSRLPPLVPEQREELDRAFHADLGGADFVPAFRDKPNVLLVLVEGVSGVDLPAIAELHGHPEHATMTELDAIGRKNVYYRSFVTHQRGTNRGLFMSLCGDYDKLGTATAKMTEVAAGTPRECLPAALGKNGYETVYMQAAPLAFMLKDTFMPKIGFARTLGSEQFSKSYARSNWGVDDRAFFEHTRHVVQELRAKRSPWFMTLLTVGTHHPYPVPDDFATPEPNGSFGRAARYTDRAIADFVRGLEADGALEDTIVLFTADESHGLEDGGDDVSKLLTQNLSYMIALLPTRQQRMVDELYAQTDTALGVLDVLGLADTAGPFIGRSLFRLYGDDRRVFFANQNARTVGMIGSKQRNAWICDELFTGCDHLHLPGGSFVSTSRAITPASHEDMAFLAAAQARAAGEEVSPFRELRLASDRLVPVIATDEQLVYAGQYFDVPADAELDVDVEVEALGDRGEVLLTTDLVANAGGTTLYRPGPFTMKAGDVAVLRYTYRVESAMRWMEARAMTKRIGSEDLAIRFTHASVRIRGGAPGGAPGLTLHERALRRPSGVN